MNKITCNTIKDILPLYVDEAVSEDTRNLVAEHLSQCPSCRKIYEAMADALVMPIDNSVSTLKRFKRAWKWKQIAISAISVMLTLILSATGYLIYQNVGAVHDFFSPYALVFLNGTDTSGQWQQLNVGETGYLVFDSLFYEKEVILDGNSPGPVTLQIQDLEGNIVLADLTLQPGRAASLETLRRNTPYLVEFKTSADSICIRFV